MSQIRCPLCGHLCFDKINFASHIRRCKEVDKNHRFNHKKKPKKRNRGK